MQHVTRDMQVGALQAATDARLAALVAERNAVAPAMPAEALQSQTALQEKLKRVRNTFADIRRQVGYPDDY